MFFIFIYSTKPIIIMQLIRGLHNLKKQLFGGCVATIGNYDGVHLGHQEILNILKKKSVELKLPAMVVIFEPQPEEFFTQDKTMRLTSFREKILLLEQYKVDYVVILSFNSYLANIAASQFVAEILVNSLRVRCLVVGDDFVFGYKRAGGYSLLKQEAIVGGFQVIKIPSFKIEGVRVSSTLIRAALWHDELHIATKFLGRPYRVYGRVVHGNNIGSNLGFPTANIHLKQRELPLLGVYAVKVYDLAMTPLFGVTNIGFHPTISNENKVFEVYIFNFNANIYGKRVGIEFCKKIRNEQKFHSLVELKLQIKKDVAMARAMFGV